jgi:CRP-like cAMP-binding protein
VLPTLDDLAIESKYRAGEIIYHQHDPAEYWYKVLSGAARKTALMLDGRRHIVMFMLPGDLFGYGDHERHRFSVEAICDGTRIARYPRRRVEALADSDVAVGRVVRDAAFGAIAGLQDRMVLLGRSSALERVGAFLLETAERLAADNSTVQLPMSRYDIADYLGLSVETVSRAVTSLRERGAIAMNGSRHIEIRDKKALTFGLHRDHVRAHTVDKRQCRGANVGVSMTGSQQP